MFEQSCKGDRGLSGKLLSENPLHQRWLGISPLPHVVVDPNVLGVERVSTGTPQCSDAIA